MPPPEIVSNQYGNLTVISTQSPSAAVSKPLKNCKCELTNDRGYVVYSALGSFYIPMFVMLFFYWRIYRAAVRTTRAINQGFKTTKGKRLYTYTNYYAFIFIYDNYLLLRLLFSSMCYLNILYIN